ncbi:MAG: hypothetical protein DWH91_02850 [Planctomycetota bacterium]|nr:MAG: hypothetical protein DWH91_02850 [Planctomycetota bacterium]
MLESTEFVGGHRSAESRSHRASFRASSCDGFGKSEICVVATIYAEIRETQRVIRGYTSIERDACSW